MKRTNIYLTIGLIIAFFFGAMVTFPTIFTDQSPYEITGVESYRTETGDYEFRTPPFEPGEKFALGSDDSGRDVLSFVIYGAKLTLSIGLSVAFFRFALGMFFGIRSAMGKPMSTLCVDQFNNVFNAIPPLIICIIVLSIGYLKALPKTYSIMVFVSVMTLVEWSRVAVLVRERAVVILSKDFIKSERIIGKSDRGIVFEHLLPHMFSELIVLFFMEISRVLTLMMQLGIFGIFIGNLKIVSDTGPGMVIGKKTSYEPEWASMLGSSKNYIRVAPWIIFSCSAAFFISVLGFNFIGEGLRMLYQEGNRLFKNKRQQLVGLIVILTVFGLGFAMTFEPSVASSDQGNSFEVVPEISLAGSDAAESLAGDIVERFETLGLEKTKGQYLYPYEVQSYQEVKKAEVFVDNKRLSYGVEAIGLLSFESFSGKGPVVDLREVDIVARDYSDDVFRKLVKNSFVMIDGDLLDEAGILYFSEALLMNTEALGVIVPVDTPNNKLVGVTKLSGPVITVKRRQADTMIGQELSVEIESQECSGTGYNVVGQIVSPSAHEKTKGIILGFQYNYLDEAMGLEQMNYAMNIISDLVANKAQLKRNITVVFWDGTYDDALSGMNSYYKEYYYPVKHTMVYLDMTQLFMEEGKRRKIIFNDDYITLAQPDAYSLKTHLLGELGEIGESADTLKKEYSVFYHKRGIQVLYLGVDGHQDNSELMDQLREVVVETLIREIY